ncbi:MAG: DNA polymerase III subunit gamma/tau [Myxococcales bacterium FL481]|nr:MAG: DNA polymerase III subunit gamma/tau [Myxococcales bacterium FL481]
MAYLVLARKYRPERFADMVGQEHVTRTLTNALHHDRLHHAYLFCGVRGLGKTTAARILAKCLVCEHGPTIDPCNVCDECRAVTQGRSTDVIEIDGASNNSVDDIRALRDKVHYLPQSARRKIYIIDEVHMLTASAFNALLKTLEEPPPHVTFLFATTDPHKVLPTILSRVARLDFRPATQATLVAHLRDVSGREGVTVDDGGLGVIARCADGSIRDGLTLLDKVIAFAQDPADITEAEVQQILGQSDRFAVAELVDAILGRDGELTLRRFSELCQASHSLPRLAVAILQHLRDLAVVKACADTSALLDASDALQARLLSQAKQAELVVLGQLFDRFAHVVDGLEDAKAPRLTLDMALLDLAQAEPLVPIGELVEELRNLGGPASPAAGGSGPSPEPAPRPASSAGSATAIPTRRTPGRTASESGVVHRADDPPSSEDPPDRAAPRMAPTKSVPKTATSPSVPTSRDLTAPRSPAAAATDELTASPSSTATPHRTSSSAPSLANTDRDASGQVTEPRATETRRSDAQADRPSDPPQKLEEAQLGVAPDARPRENAQSSGRADPTEPGGHPIDNCSAQLPPPADPVLTDRLWALVNGARESGDAGKPEVRSQANAGPRGASGLAAAPGVPAASGADRDGGPETPASAAPADPPEDSTAIPSLPIRAGIHAAPTTASSAPSSAPPSLPAADLESNGCAGPRCIPAERVPWRELAPLAAWEAFLERVLNEDEMLYAVLVDLGFVALDERQLRLTGPAGGMARRQLDEPDVAARLDELVQRYLGQRFELTCQDREPDLDDAPSVAQLQQRRREEHQAELESEAQGHPVVQALLRRFGGQIRNVRPSPPA